MLVKYEGGLKFTAEARGHKIAVDQPEAAGGADQGMTPPELLAASLGSCIGVYIVEYCHRARINCEGMTIDVAWEKASDPARIGRMRAIVDIPEGIPETRRSAVRRVAEKCLIHQTLHGRPDITIELV